jgi:hypothetical protein
VPIILAVAGGLYVYSVEGVGYGSLVEFEGPVVPIDPKFLAETIDLAEYGIDLASIVLGVMGGAGRARITGAGDLWQRINAAEGNVIFRVRFGDKTLTLSPSCRVKNHNGYVLTVCMNLTATNYGSIINASVVIIGDEGVSGPLDSGYIVASASSVPVPEE